MKFRKALEKPAPSFVGAEYETCVELLLLDNGLPTLARNFRCKLGEIDLIMEDGESQLPLRCCRC
ncbi:MAG: YraN family protein, partial [Gammaproteobacteria bacterium]